MCPYLVISGLGLFLSLAMPFKNEFFTLLCNSLCLYYFRILSFSPNVLWVWGVKSWSVKKHLYRIRNLLYSSVSHLSSATYISILKGQQGHQSPGQETCQALRFVGITCSFSWPRKFYSIISDKDNRSQWVFGTSFKFFQLSDGEGSSLTSLPVTHWSSLVLKVRT